MCVRTMTQPMQQQPVFTHDLHEACEKSYTPCERDGTTVEVPSYVWGGLRISRCSARDGKCGELFIEQMITGHEIPLHVLGREDPILVDICANAYRIALEQEGRRELISLGRISPVVVDL